MIYAALRGGAWESWRTGWERHPFVHVLRPDRAHRRVKGGIGEVTNRDADLARSQVGRPVNGATAFRAKIIRHDAIGVFDLADKGFYRACELHGLTWKIRAYSERASRPPLALQTVAERDHVW